MTSFNVEVEEIQRTGGDVRGTRRQCHREKRCCSMLKMPTWSVRQQSRHCHLRNQNVTFVTYYHDLVWIIPRYYVRQQLRHCHLRN